MPEKEEKNVYCATNSHDGYHMECPNKHHVCGSCVFGNFIKVCPQCKETMKPDISKLPSLH